MHEIQKRAGRTILDIRKAQDLSTVDLFQQLDWLPVDERTDHSALQWLLNFKNPKDQMARWLAKLQQYIFCVEHRSGVKHGNADALSRRPCMPCRHCEKREMEDGYSVAANPLKQKEVLFADRGGGVDTGSQPQTQDRTAMDCNELREAQLEDRSLRQVILWMEEGKRPSWNEISPYSPEVKAYWSQWDALCLDQGVLYRKQYSTTSIDQQHQLVVPLCLRDDILREMHDEPTSGHLGMAKTLGRLRTRFYWVNHR